MESNNARTTYLKLKQRAISVIERNCLVVKEIPERAVATNGTKKPKATRGPSISDHRLSEYVSVVKLEEWRPYGKEK